jgi:hypothetical protein
MSCETLAYFGEGGLGNWEISVCAWLDGTGPPRVERQLLLVKLPLLFTSVRMNLDNLGAVLTATSTHSFTKLDNSPYKALVVLLECRRLLSVDAGGPAAFVFAGEHFIINGFISHGRKGVLGFWGFGGPDPPWGSYLQPPLLQATFGGL